MKELPKYMKKCGKPKLLFRNRKFFFIILFLSANSAISQQQYLPLNRAYSLSVEKQLSHTGNDFHSSFKPYLQSKISESFNYDSVINRSEKKDISAIHRKLRYENLVSVNTPDFMLTIDPLFNFEYGKDFSDSSLKSDTTILYKNTRGIIIRGNIGSKVSFTSFFYENQAFFPSYIEAFVIDNGVVPGQGRAKIFKGTGFDFAMSSGWISYSPSARMNFQAGHGKNFVGDGYRSMLLSDNSFNYPFFKFTGNLEKIQYTLLLASFQNLNVILPTSSTTEPRFQRKSGIFHHISRSINKRMQLSLFHGLLIINASSNLIIINGLAGANIKIKIIDKFSFYSQVAIDDPKKNQYAYAWQAGIKLFDIPVKNLNFQAEVNSAQPYTYLYDNSSFGFSHYNQPLAHPLGAGFTEVIAILNYKWNDFFAEVKNINTQVVSLQEFNLRYLINPKTNMSIFTGFINRFEKNSSVSKNTRFIYLGIRTSLENIYYDF